MPEQSSSQSYCYVFEALKHRWENAGLVTQIPGGIYRDHPPERTPGPYIVARLVTEYTLNRTNRSRYDRVDFELTAAAETPEAASVAIALIVEALRVPLVMGQDARQVDMWPSDSKAGQEMQKGRTAQGFSCIVARSRFNPSNINR